MLQTSGGVYGQNEVEWAPWLRTLAGRTVRLAVDLFNLLDARDSDIDYYYTSRLPGEPLAGIGDIHAHPSLPRAVRVSLMLGF